ncbi:MAG: hypothetical protein OCD76_07740 [Reichenbachiella sp.]
MGNAIAKMEEQQQIFSDLDSVRSIIKGMCRIIKLKASGQITPLEFERKFELLERIGARVLN